MASLTRRERDPVESTSETAAFFHQDQPIEAGIAEWSCINALFHTTIVEAAGSTVIADAIARNNHLPFASSDSITIDSSALDKEFKKL